MSQSRNVLSVSEITAQIKWQIESQFSSIWIQGEISNFKHHSSGHMYFTVRDDSAELRCVMFRGYNQMIHFKPENGMEVLMPRVQPNDPFQTGKWNGSFNARKDYSLRT